MKVTLVGAGPYDAGLITVKGLQELQKADVVVYDKLVNQGLINGLPGELVYVGKEGANHTLPQGEINNLLVEKALAGKNVVRLKGGDPFLFGRGGEEMEYIKAHGIPYEVIPGVSSAFSVPAYGGIPLSHRDISSAVHIFTGHRKEDGVLGLDFDVLARLTGTLVFLMGVGSMAEIATGLQAAGMEPDTPAAVIENGTTGKQRVITATIGTVVQQGQKEQIQPPAVFVVGRVCEMAAHYGWLADKPLHGLRVVVAAHRDTAPDLCQLLWEKGCDAIAMPCVETVPVPFRLQKEPEDLDWLVFTSKHGVHNFFQGLHPSGLDFRRFAHCKIGVIGEKTGETLATYGLTADFMPPRFDGRSLGEGLRDKVEKGILLVQPENSSERVVDVFRENGMPYTVLQVYKTLPVAYQHMVSYDADYTVFTSPSCVAAFMAAYKGKLKGENVTAICIGPETAQTAKEHGMVVHMAKQAALESVVKRIQELKEHGL